MTACNSKRVLACDVYVNGAESAERVPGGFSFGEVINVDHHAPHPNMYRHISSTNLAFDWIRERGVDETDLIVVISHTDCDSVLASGVLSGDLDPDPNFAYAAIAADHTGEANDIADLLQAIDKTRDIRYCLDTLRRFRDL